MAAARGGNERVVLIARITPPVVSRNMGAVLLRLHRGEPATGGLRRVPAKTEAALLRHGWVKGEGDAMQLTDTGRLLAKVLAGE